MKIKMHKDFNVIDARLKEVLNLIHAKRPLLEYEVVHGTMDRATSVTVWQDGQKLGQIWSSYQRYSPSKGTNETMYAVASHTIKKQRGNHKDTRMCKDGKTAARIAIESFTKRTLAELGERLIKIVVDNVETLHSTSHYKYTNALTYPTLTLANYFTDIAMGKNPPPPQIIMDRVTTADMIRKRETFEIASNVLEHVKRRNGYCIRMMQDETLLFTHIGNSATTSKHQSTYELDQYTQEKYTMLKLLEPNQFAADIGVKFQHTDASIEATYYFIVAGETVTH